MACTPPFSKWFNEPKTVSTGDILGDHNAFVVPVNLGPTKGVRNRGWVHSPNSGKSQWVGFPNSVWYSAHEADGQAFENWGRDSRLRRQFPGDVRFHGLRLLRRGHRAGLLPHAQ